MSLLTPSFPGPLLVERSALRTPDDVAGMLQLHALGWGGKLLFDLLLTASRSLGGAPGCQTLFAN